MRIRSIKPEYWSHRIHEVISETASLLAVGLLNYADDEGRFIATPRTIECILFPSRAPKKPIEKCLQELEAAGFIKRYSAPIDGREITLGVIVSFRKHQVVSKPYPSRLPAPPFHDHSGNDTGTVTESSGNATESFPDDSRHGKEGNRIGIGKDKEKDTDSPKSSPAVSSPRSPKASREPLSPASQPEPIAARMLAINSLVGRRPSTCWAPAELAALHAAGLGACTDADFAEQLAPLISFYQSAQVPDPKDRNNLLNYRRSDLGTLLNHWAGEIDKATRWRATVNSLAYASQPTEGLTGAN